MTNRAPHPLRRPLTDAFGTRLDPDALLAGLARCGLNAPRLVLTDTAVVLEHDPALSEGDDPVALGLTWLREQLSPLMSCTARPAPVGGAPLNDERTRPLSAVMLAEVAGGPEGLDAAAADLFARLDLPENPGPAPTFDLPAELPADLGPLVADLARGLAEAAGRHGAPTATLTYLRWTARGPQPLTPLPADGTPGPHLLAWWRPGDCDLGERPAVLLAASFDAAATRWLASALDDAPPPSPAAFDVLLDGLVWGVGRRPMVAVPPDSARPEPIRVDPGRCIDCGLCAAICPVDYLAPKGVPATDDPEVCIGCYECVEVCPSDALRPVRAADGATLATALDHRPGWLSRLRGAPGPPFPAPFPPSYLTPRAPDDERPVRTVLGLAVLTMAEHAAVLIHDGELLGAIEEEKLARVRHYGWRTPGRPDWLTPAVDPTVQLEEVLCRRSVRKLLDDAGLTLDDVDLFCVNGLHGRYRQTFSHLHADDPIPTLRAGRVLSIPHHLCHAASAFHVSGADSAWIFTVDGRGDRETAGIFRAEGGRIEPRHTLLSLDDRSIGGVYYTVTQLLGFGAYGQGSVMALAGFGTPDPEAMTPFLSARGLDDWTVHERGLPEAFAECRRSFEQPTEARHHNLAASLQTALEEVALTLVGEAVSRGGDSPPIDALCLAGGVSLNCHMNSRLRLALKPELIFAQPGANDGGTALGAALEGWVHAHGPTRFAPMTHALWGPAYGDKAVEAALIEAGLSYERSGDVAAEAADRLAEGQVLCWFQGRMEFGPRALGGRSIIADPRSAAIKDRVNQLKDRESWRPFGPSMLAGHESEWLEDAFDSRFMLFTLTVKPERRAQVPAIVHVDGTTRPQMVHADTHPEYHRMLSRFFELTGVPMVLNTSFNRRGESIVCTPAQAVDAFLGLGADAMAIGSFIVSPRAAGAQARPAPTPPSPLRLYADDEALNDRLAGAPGHLRQLRATLARRPAPVHIPLLTETLPRLRRVVKVAARLGASAITLELPAPIERPQGLQTKALPRLARAARYATAAAQTARSLGLSVRTTGLPLCHLPPELHPAAQVDTAPPGPLPEPCRGCSLSPRCPRSDALYFELYGTGELTPAP